MSQATKGIEQQLIIVRRIDAPRKEVWNAWTDPLEIVRWWGPEYFTSPFASVDLKVGGHYLYCMRDPKGNDYWSTGVFKEIADQEKIVATDSFADENGNIVPASKYGMKGNWPMERLMTVNFKEEEGGTKLCIQHTGFPPGENVEQAAMGWNTSLDKLVDFLMMRQGKPRLAPDEMSFMVSSDREVITRCLVDAPPEDVFNAYADPDILARWWGPRDLRNDVKKLDMVAGGEWVIDQYDRSGNRYGFSGRFLEVDPPHRLVQTFEYEPQKGHAVEQEVAIENIAGQSLIRSRSRFKSAEDLQAMMAPGMAKGALESMERLRELCIRPQRIVLNA